MYALAHASYMIKNVIHSHWPYPHYGTEVDRFKIEGHERTRTSWWKPNAAENITYRVERGGGSIAVWEGL